MNQNQTLEETIKNSLETLDGRHESEIAGVLDA